MNDGLKVGITGGIGAGKSIISQIFSTLGIPVYDADSRAKWLMNHDNELQKSIIKLFGPDAFINGQLNREHLAKTAFGQPEKLQQLNGLVHPKVGEDYKQWVTANDAKPYTIKEAALLFESGSYKELDAVIYVSAPEELRIERVLKRDPHRTKEDVIEIIKRQWPEEKKKELADYEVINDQASRLIPQVLRLHDLFLDKIKG